MANFQTSFSGRPTGGPQARFFSEKLKPADTRKTVKRILAYLAQKRLALGLVFVLSIVSTAVSIVGTRLNGYTVDHFIGTGDIRGLASICLIMLGIYVVGVISTYIQNVLMVGIAQKTSASIRKDLFIHLQHLPLRYFDTHASGDIMSRLTNDVDNINIMLSQGVVQLFSGLITITGMLAAMLILDPRLTLIALTTTPLMFFLTRFIAKHTRQYFASQQKELGNLNGYIEEMVSGQKAVTLFSQKQQVLQGFSQINQRFVRASTAAHALSGILGPLNNLINNTTYLIITICGSLFIIKGMDLTIGTVFSFLLYMRHFTRPINDILSLFNTVQSALAGSERVFEVIDTPKEEDLPTARDIDVLHGAVCFEQVDFSYIPGKPVLKKADLQAEPGQTVAIVGPTGAGKTTIINLLTRFYDFDGGSILIDGKDIHDITLESLRSKVSVVLQDPFLFSETVRENIRYGRLSASDDEVEQAAHQARAHEFILQLPNGYDTVLADNGGNLSQGQRQLLSIARAIIAQSSILILDEATSSIDTRTEVLIQEALLTLMKGKTSFVIAHRLSTIRNADRIVVVDDGHVVEAGRHDGLMAAGGFYAGLYNSQFKTGMAL